MAIIKANVEKFMKLREKFANDLKKSQEVSHQS
jgi:hypothetical protein